MVNKFWNIIKRQKEKSWLKSIITYMIDWNVRKAVNLSTWLSNQVNNENDLDKLALKLKGSSDDETMMNIYSYVLKNLSYKSDQSVWGVPEKWQQAIITAVLKTGDCEDGAILMFVLARKAGIPAEKVRIVCGSVQSSPTAPMGGHCWLSYTKDFFDYFLDWCYYPKRVGWKYHKPFIIGSSYYKSVWFMSNDVRGYK